MWSPARLTKVRCPQCGMMRNATPDVPFHMEGPEKVADRACVYCTTPER